MLCKNRRHYALLILITTIILVFIIIIYNTNDQDTYKDGYFINETYIEAPLLSVKNNIFDLHFQYILNNKTICKNDSDILAVLIVTSYFGNVETRSAMRRAFSQEGLIQFKLRRVFLLGKAHDSNYVTQSAILNENKRYADVIQGNFNEAYRNLTYKHIMGLKWATDFCYNAKYIIKMDDDIVINVEKIPFILKSLKISKSGNLLAGYVLRGLNPIREPANKWYVSKEEYELTSYPTFVSGWFYITTPNTSRRLVTLSHYFKYFWIDDLFVTGILAQKLKIRHYNIGMYFTLHSEYLECCISDYKKNHLNCDILIGPNGGDNNLFYTYNEMVRSCSLLNCVERQKPLTETCVAEKKEFLNNGNAIIETYKLH